MRLFKRTIFVIFVSILSFSAFANQSTQVKPRYNQIRQALTPYVDPKQCAAPIRSSPYVIFGGNGGGDMNIQCPADRPIMYGWRQKMGFAGSMAVSFGGGRTWITCCAVSQAWHERREPIKEG